MTYNPVQAEINWYKPGPNTQASERHEFPHKLVHSRFAEYLKDIGCNSRSTVLDIGCGSGDEMEFISAVTENVTGIDISQIAIGSFREKGYEGMIADVKSLPFSNESFDYVICPEILHHLKGQGYLVEYLLEFIRVLRPDGYLIALEPNAFNVSGMLMNMANTMKPGITGLVPHERALSPLYLRSIFKKAGMTEVKYTAASFVWNRLPLCISKWIAGHEGAIRHKVPFRSFGWFSIVSGKK